jgi:TrmH family RNA methyltransferase
LIITSTSNPAVRDFRSLLNRRERDQACRFLIEGVEEIGRAFRAGIEVEEMLVAESFEHRVPVGWPHRLVKDAVMEKVSYRGAVVAKATMFPVGLDRIFPAENPLVLVVEGIEKPGNLGAMLRTADAVGAAVIVCDPDVDVFNPNVVRASLGSLFTVPLAVADAAGAIAWSSLHSLQPMVATVEAGASFWELDMSGPVAVVVGSEHEGASQPWRDAGRQIRIPMRGEIDSLNASVAAAVLLYEAFRQRSGRPMTGGA